MAFIARLGAALIIVATAFSAVFAHQIRNGPSSCKKNNFWYEKKDCCLPSGGPPSPPPPPKDTRCPPSGWYWGQSQGCCLPHYPPVSNRPPPQCPTGWEWVEATHKCKPCENPPPAPRPSQRTPTKGKGDNDHDYHSPSRHGHRALLSRTPRACPYGLDACPVSRLSGDYECLDTAVELESCGGCASIGEGQDCSIIKNAWNVGCEQGVCKVYTCAGGFARSADGISCISL